MQQHWLLATLVIATSIAVHRLREHAGEIRTGLLVGLAQAHQEAVYLGHVRSLKVRSEDADCAFQLPADTVRQCRWPGTRQRASMPRPPVWCRQPHSARDLGISYSVGTLAEASWTVSGRANSELAGRVLAERLCLVLRVPAVHKLRREGRRG